VALNVDGLDRQRRKWGLIASSYLHFCEMLSVLTPTRVVTDGRSIQDYYRARYRKDTTMIGYGAELPPESAEGNSPDSPLIKFGLAPKKFILYVSRLEPENHPELVIRAYKQVETDWPLVMVGSNAYKPDYEARLRAAADPRVLFTGSIYGLGYWELQRNAAFFVFGCEVGGIHPALIETMAAGNPSLYLDTESNRDTAADCGLVFSADENDLASKMRQLLSDSDLRSKLSVCARERARELYGWDQVTEKYEELFQSLKLRC
jgi:glycosyltransferase involved in cell wall biosynthesis